MHEIQQIIIHSYGSSKHAGFRNQMLSAIRGFSMSRKSGLFINSCFAHCQSERQDTWYANNSPQLGYKVWFIKLLLFSASNSHANIFEKVTNNSSYVYYILFDKICHLMDIDSCAIRWHTEENIRWITTKAWSLFTFPVRPTVKTDELKLVFLFFIWFISCSWSTMQ